MPTGSRISSARRAAMTSPTSLEFTEAQSAGCRRRDGAQGQVGRGGEDAARPKEFRRSSGGEDAKWPWMARRGFEL